jgi:hypothetical protein
VAVERREVPPQFAQVQLTSDPAQQVIGGNVIIQVERVEQLLLTTRPLSHHLRISLSDALLSA